MTSLLIRTSIGVASIKVATFSLNIGWQAGRVALDVLGKLPGDVSVIDLIGCYEDLRTRYPNPPTVQQHRMIYGHRHTVASVLSCVKDFIGGPSSGHRIIVRLHRCGTIPNVVCRIEQDILNLLVVGYNGESVPAFECRYLGAVRRERS